MRILGAIFIVLLGLSACTNSNGNSFVLIGNPFVDLAVGDDGNATPADSRVVLYYDVLNEQKADVVLDNTHSLVNGPRSIVLVDGDLYVGNVGGSNITIYRAYRGLADNAAPDVVLDAVAGITHPKEIKVKGNTLFVNDDTDNEVNIFFDAAALTADVAPNVTLNNGSSLVANPDGIDFDGSDLYVANAATPSVTIYRDVPTLATNDAPDVVLGAATSFQGLSTGVHGAIVSNDILYVPSDPNLLFIFEGAASLATDDLPNAVVVPDADPASAPLDAVGVEFNVFVALRQPSVGTDGLIMFGPQGEIADGAEPSLSFPNVPSAHALAGAGDALFVSVMNENDATNAVHKVFIYTNAGFFNQDSQFLDPTFKLDAADFVRPLGIAAVER